MSETTAVDTDHELLVSLVAHIDKHHDSDTNYCHPRVPDDCSPYCRACEALRPVRDDVLTDARALLRADGYYR